MMRVVWTLITFCVLAGSGQAHAATDIVAVVNRACVQWDVPPKLVMAIIKQESGANLWAVNVAGKGYLPRSKKEALTIAKEAQASGKSFDVGLMQVNSYWLKRFKLQPEVVIEPENNILLGTWILANEIQRFGLSWQAVGSYHTPLHRNPERAEKYARSVIRHLQAIK